MKKLIKKSWMPIISIFFALILLFIVFNFVSFYEVLLLLKNANWKYVYILILIYMGIIFGGAYRWKRIILSKGKNVSVWKTASYNFVGTGLGYLLPGMRITGDPVRGLLLKRHGLSFKKGFSTVVIDRTIDVTVSGLFFSFFAVTSIVFLALPKKWNWIIGILTFLSLMAIFYFYYVVLNKKDVLLRWFKNLRLNKIKRLVKYEKWISEFENEVIQFYKKDRKNFIIVNCVALFDSFLWFLGYKTAALIVGQNIGFIQTFMVLTTSGLATWVPTPLGLGSGEAIEAGLFTVLGLGATAGVGLSLIYRLIDLIMLIFGTIAISWYGISFMKLVREKVVEINPEKEKIRKEKLKEIKSKTK